MSHQKKIILSFDDDYLIAIKPSGISTSKSSVHEKESFQDLVRGSEEYTSLGQGRFLEPCHQLDKLTSGIVLFARNKSSLKHIHNQFEMREIKKGYVARCVVSHNRRDGFSKLEQGKKLLGAIHTISKEYKSGNHTFPGYKKVITTVLRAEEISPDLIEIYLSPETGRTHQLRIQLSSLGYPILGDPLYGKQAYPENGSLMHLHSYHISFMHPKKHQKIEFHHFPDWIK